MTTIVDSLRTARENGQRPSAPDADLSGADLSGANLRDANLSGADLWDANLSGANLRGANLRDADLSDADLSGADLSGADLRDANLSGADLWDADLSGANLRDANLSGANLRDADLSGANLRDANLSGANLTNTWGGVLSVTGLPSGHAVLTPTPAGWALRVGCWTGTIDDLRALTAQDTGWPEARGAEVTRRRPGLESLTALCDAHTAAHHDALTAVQDNWGTTGRNPS